ncbi:MAG: Uma2 family endonuclease [Candidatus Eremiobacteraeota bacterium]|nr:Uma2 family endonuclease [Candidatus Eremiobacteraeota bacterium]
MRVSSANPGWRVERAADGTLTMTPPTGAATSNRNARLTRMFVEWAAGHSYVAFDSNGGFRLPDTSVVGPDASLVPEESWNRLGAKERERFFPGAPAVAVELCSDSDNPKELRAKLQRIRAAGASYVVLIDPYRKEIWTDGTAPPDFDLDFSLLLE